VTSERPALRFTTTAKASADARALAQSGLVRLDLVVDSVALLFAIFLALNDALLLAVVVAVGVVPVLSGDAPAPDGDGASNRVSKLVG
jgi:hypothetical protein